MFDKVCGTDNIRRDLKAGKTATEIVRSWKPGEDEFRRKREKYLLYADVVLTKAAPVNESKPAPTPAPRPAAAAEAKAELPTTPTGSVPQQPPPLIITVSRGDSPAKIANDFNISASDIAEANPGVNLNKLKVGQQLKIPRCVAK